MIIFDSSLRFWDTLYMWAYYYCNSPAFSCKTQ